MSQVPEVWENGMITLQNKKGDITKQGNYRPQLCSQYDHKIYPDADGVTVDTACRS